MDGNDDRAPDPDERGGRPGPVVVAGLVLVSVAFVVLIYAMLR